MVWSEMYADKLSAGAAVVNRACCRKVIFSSHYVVFSLHIDPLEHRPAPRGSAEPRRSSRSQRRQSPSPGRPRLIIMSSRGALVPTPPPTLASKANLCASASAGRSGTSRRIARISPVVGSVAITIGGSVPSRISTVPPGPESTRLASSDSQSSCTGKANTKAEPPSPISPRGRIGGCDGVSSNPAPEPNESIAVGVNGYGLVSHVTCLDTLDTFIPEFNACRSDGRPTTRPAEVEVPEC